MPNGRRSRHRFSVKQNIATKSPKEAQNSSDPNISSTEQKLNNSPQNCKPNKFKNKEFPTGSKDTELSTLIESDSSHHTVPNRTQSVDKDVMVTSSNIDFFNIINLSNVRLPKSEGQTTESPKANQKDTADKKETKNPRRDNYLRHHRMKVRSPRRRVTGEVIMENNKITTDMGTIDWNQEEEKSNNGVSTEQKVTNAEQKVTNIEQQQSEQDSTNNVQKDKPNNDNNLKNYSISIKQDDSTIQTYPISASNSTNQKKLVNQITPNNQIDPENRTVQSFPVHVYEISPVNQNLPILNESNLPNSNNQLNIITQDIHSNPISLNNYASPVNQNNHPSNNSIDVMCRICHGGESLSAESGQMISACGCRGTVGRVHVKCLERWLTESGKSKCELCGTRYSTKRVHKYGFPKALAIWVLSQNAKQLMVDSLGIMLMSPLAVVAAWLSGRTLAGLMTPESHQTPWPLASTFVLACMTLLMVDSLGIMLMSPLAVVAAWLSGRTLAGLMTPESHQTPWPLASTFVLACMTLVCYYCWIVSAVTRHALGWWIWYRSQYEVRLQLQENEE